MVDLEINKSVSTGNCTTGNYLNANRIVVGFILLKELCLECCHLDFLNYAAKEQLTLGFQAITQSFKALYKKCYSTHEKFWHLVGVRWVMGRGGVSDKMGGVTN